MRFAKPSYDAKERVYTCEVSDGFRFSVRRESGSFIKDPESCIDSDERISHLIKSTEGWFLKPLTEMSLRGKIRYDIPTSVPAYFEGLVEWQIQQLIISKEQFLFIFTITQTVEDAKMTLEFPEPEDEIPLHIESPPICIGPTRRNIEKEKVLSVRTKAARALFHAERLTQEFYQNFGETDWEDEE